MNNFYKEVKIRIKYFLDNPIFYPKLIIKKIKGKLSTIPNVPVIKKIKNINFIFPFFDFEPKMPDLYLGVHQINVIRVLHKYIKKGDIFIDVGANIGYISAIGANLVWKKGEVHSFEPVPIYFKFLSKMAKLNKRYKIVANNYALGENVGSAKINIPNIHNIGHNSMVPGLIEVDKIKEAIKVKVNRLDDYIFRNKIENVSFIKIDVEGFEYPILKGLTKFFNNEMISLPPILVEINPSAYPLLGLKLKNLKHLMSKYSYKAHTIYKERPIEVKNLINTRDILFKQI